MLSDQNLRLIYTAFINYFNKNKIVYKEIFYNYRIELFTHHYTIFIKYKIDPNNDYCNIKIYNDATNKCIEHIMNYNEENIFESFGDEAIRKLLSELN